MGHRFSGEPNCAKLVKPTKPIPPCSNERTNLPSTSAIGDVRIIFNHLRMTVSLLVHTLIHICDPLLLRLAFISHGLICRIRILGQTFVVRIVS